MRVNAKAHNEIVAELIAIEAALGVHLRNLQAR
jgi:hypothetical protein